MPLIENERGHYAFLKGLGPYSAGVIASAGYEIEHVRLLPARPLEAGLEFIRAHLKRLHRPLQALCGMELRIPAPLSFQGFASFNQRYVQVLESWDIFVGGLNPVARTNVAPRIDPPSEPMLFGFSYTTSAAAAGNTFIVAGAGELPEGSLDEQHIVRRGDITSAALEEKAGYVLGIMEDRLKGMGVSWAEAAHTSIYTVHDVRPFLATLILRRMGAAQLQGVTCYFACPPVIGVEYEMDLRRCRSELVL